MVYGLGFRGQGLGFKVCHRLGKMNHRGDIAKVDKWTALSGPLSISPAKKRLSLDCPSIHPLRNFEGTAAADTVGLGSSQPSFQIETVYFW